MGDAADLEPRILAWRSLSSDGTPLPIGTGLVPPAA